MTAFDPTYLRDVIGGRHEVDWFSPAPQNDPFLAGPAEVYLTTEAGTVTWGWSVEPVPVDAAGRNFRRFRHSDGWTMLTDADDPETVFLVSTVELHTVTDSNDETVHALGVEAGEVPSSGDAYALQKGAENGRYRIDHAWLKSAVSAALTLWCQIFLERDTTLVERSPTAAERTAIAELTGEVDEVVPDTTPLGHDEEVASIIEGYDDIFWFQADLTWPDRDDYEAFRDRVDVRLRDPEGTDTWLLSVEPLDATPGSHRLAEDGAEMVLDPDDPSVIRLEWDRIVLAVSVQETGFEPAGVAVPLGVAPGTDQWEELRRVRAAHTQSVVIHAPAWSEGRVSAALTEWASAWTGSSRRFLYDFDDPVGQSAIEANNMLENAPPVVRSVRTATREVCRHTDAVISPYEDPLPCGLPATAYYRDGDDLIVVCDAHAPAGVKLTTLLRA
jgi:hypothetical protein